MTKSKSVESKYVPPRTFGDLRSLIWDAHGTVSNADNTCAFCKRYGRDVGGLARYSTRHCICGPCIKPRKDQLLPAVQKQERFEAAMAKLRLEGEEAGRR